MLNEIIPRVTSALHDRLIFGRRVQALADNITEMIPAGATRLLDVGCGDGTLARAIAERRPAVQPMGVEIRARPNTAIPVTEFDGRLLPFAGGSYDVVMLVDVLHHAEDPGILIAEAARVAASAVIIKDHLADAWLSHGRLRMMDWVGNIGHGVPLPYAYWSDREWRTAFKNAGLREVHRRENLGLYGPMLRLLFERRLHFVSCLVSVGV
jgi:SAM-dependent methyltransferase